MFSSITIRVAQGARGTGFDISVTRLREARQRVTGPLQCAAEMPPFSEGAFAAVLSKQIRHRLDLKITIPEIARVLRPGGRAVFLEPLIHNPILEGYRRLTPHLCSPTERALSMRDATIMSSHFRRCRHQEFILLAILPAAGGGRAGPQTRRTGRLAAAPASGRPQAAGRLARPGPLLLGDGHCAGALVARTDSTDNCKGQSSRCGLVNAASAPSVLCANAWRWLCFVLYWPDRAQDRWDQCNVNGSAHRPKPLR